MQGIIKLFENVSHLFAIAIGGLNFEMLKRFGDRGVMPNAAKFLATATQQELPQPFFFSPIASWATLETGQDVGVHGVLDEFYLDHLRRCLVKRPFNEANLQKLPEEICEISDTEFSWDAIWSRKPTSERELEIGLARTTDALQQVFAELFSAHSSRKARFLVLKLTLFDSFFQFLWDMLGIFAGPAGRRTWIAKAQAVLHVLDEQLGTLFELAAKEKAAIALASPYGFTAARENIVLNELLRRNGLLQTAAGRTRIDYEIMHFFEKKKFQLGFGNRNELPLRGLLPIDWHRTRAVSLHGENAALVYLNTPERFGGNPLSSPISTLQKREEAEAETIAAILDARHPLSGERLFQEAFSASKRFGIDPIEKQWPEVIGIPTAGFQIRQRLDHARQLVRPDSWISAVRTGESSLCWQAAGMLGSNAIY